MLEAQLQAKCIDFLKRDFPGIYFEKVILGTKSGLPDLRMCIGGKFIAVEFKQPGKVPNPLQERNLRRISEAGGMSFVIDDYVNFVTLVRHLTGSMAKNGSAKLVKEVS